MTEKRKKVPGHTNALARGLVPVSLLVTPEERELIRQAAAYSPEKSMAKFAREHVLLAANKVLRGRGLYKSEK